MAVILLFLKTFSINFGVGIPELSIKISQIRTWTYISNNHNWVKNTYYWKEKTQQIENELFN